MVEVRRSVTQSMLTPSSPKLSRARVLMACVWMPAGESQRRLLKVAVNVFALLTFQSTFGRKSRWLPVRGTEPERLLRKLSVPVTCAADRPLPTASEPERWFVAVGAVAPKKGQKTWLPVGVAVVTTAPPGAVSPQGSARVRESRERK